MRDDLRSWLVCLVGLFLICYFAATKQNLDPYWMVLLGGMIGVTVIAGSVRRQGRDDGDGNREALLRRTWPVPIVSVIVGIVITVGSIAWVLSMQYRDRLEAQRAVCETQMEFRGFLSQYLHSQIGSPAEEIKGFDQLPPDSRKLILNLSPVLDAGRETRKAFADRYTKQFPVLPCH
jgi:hypothetical protein